MVGSGPGPLGARKPADAEAGACGDRAGGPSDTEAGACGDRAGGPSDTEAGARGGVAGRAHVRAVDGGPEAGGCEVHARAVRPGAGGVREPTACGSRRGREAAAYGSRRGREAAGAGGPRAGPAETAPRARTRRLRADRGPVCLIAWTARRHRRDGPT
ncbi:hypothetical protein GCM10010273_15440 [Streptomyces lavendulocolor]